MPSRAGFEGGSSLLPGISSIFPILTLFIAILFLINVRVVIGEIRYVVCALYLARAGGEHVPVEQ
jgi:hypothetical protein